MDGATGRHGVAAAQARRSLNLHGQVSEQLALPILRGERLPGAALPTEGELCLELGVSRTTVREAMKNLVAKALVAIGPRTGTRVRPRQDWNLLDAEMMRWRLLLGVDRKLVQDIYEMRECFEPRASALAAERGSAEQHAAVAEALAAMGASGGNPVLAVEADVAFHSAILAASGNPFLCSFSAMIGTTLRASFEIARRRMVLSRSDIAMHAAVLSAIVRRDPVLARASTDQLLHCSKAAQMDAADGGMANPAG